MDYHIARDGQQLGTVSEDQLRTGLADGTYRPTDLAWGEGMSDWKPLSEIAGSHASRLPANPPSAPPRGPGAPMQAVGGQTAGLATASLVLGILSIIPCSIATGLPAIVTGHMARSKIKQSGGALLGEGKALAGLIMGYVSLVLAVVWIGLVALAAPTFAKVQEKGLQAKATSNARMICTACKIYASDNNGNYPPNLEVLFEQGILQDRKVLNCPLKVNGVEEGFEYYGAKLSDSASGNLIILMSKWSDRSGKRVVCHNDGSALVEAPRPADVPQ